MSLLKNLKKNYYDLRSKKVENLIKNLKEKRILKNQLWEDVFFLKKTKIYVLKVEKIIKF